MHIEAIQTRALIPPQDDLLAVLDAALPTLQEKSVVVVSSKVVAIWQGRCERIPEGTEEEIRECKKELALRESSLYLEKNEGFPYSRLFTIGEGVFGSNAGIDESNGQGYFVLLPKDTQQAASRILSHLVGTRGVKELGVIVTDSRTTPMRNGTTAIALGHAGVVPLYDYRGREDIFGRTLNVERMNIVDSLATAANLVIGEGSECTPLAICTDVPHLEFGLGQSGDFMLNPKVSMNDDVFAQFLKPHPWKRGGSTQ